MHNLLYQGKDLTMSIENAKLFIANVVKLESSPFWKWMLETGKKPNSSLINSETFIMHDDLRKEDLDSFCLNLRYLIQDRDGFSIRKMKEFSDTFTPEYEDYKLSIESAVNELNSNLDKPSLVQFGGDDVNTTYRKVFEILFYGGLVHFNEDKRYEFIRLASSGMFSVFVFSAFQSSLMYYRNCYMSVGYNLHHYLVSIGEEI